MMYRKVVPWLVAGLALTLSATAIASDIAISTQAGWFGQAAADREMQEIVDNVTGIAIEQFAADQHDALADWVVAHTGDGESDILILCGVFPDTIYPGGNAQPDDSIAELFLDDGNTIINTGDYMFYVNSAGSNNADGGLWNMMDIDGIGMWDDNTPVAVTAEGRAATPTLQDLQTDRPFHLDELQGDWVPELILAQNDAGTRADPVIVVNTVTGGRLGIFYQTASQDDDPRGEVISEWINNFVLTGGVIPNGPAWKPNPEDGAIEVVMPLFGWSAGYGAAMHQVYFGDSPDTLELKMEAPSTMYFHLEPMAGGQTYYWRINEVAADGSVTEGDVWSFTTMPFEAHYPSPYDGALWRKTDQTFSWTAGQGASTHRIYGGTDEALVAAGDPNALLGEKSENSFSITEVGLEALDPDTRYFWRIDELDAAGTVTPGPVWTFTTIDPEGGALATYWDNMYLEGDPCIVTVVPEINFDWGGGTVPGENSPDPCIPVDRFSCLWVAELNVPVTGTYRLFEASDDGTRMKLNGTEVAWGWWDRGTTEDATEALELVAGETYVIELEMYENGGGATAFLRWEGPGIPKEIIPQGALQLPQVAYGMSPGQGAEGVSDTTGLSWAAGMTAVEHDLYIGTDADLVLAGDASVFAGRMAETSYAFDAALPWNTTYYWKVDEVTEDGTVIPGVLYSFTTQDHEMIENFESYDDVVTTVAIEPVAAPIAQYLFEGDFNDVSGNGHDGTPMGDITIVEDAVMGMVASLPGGDNQFIEIGEVGLSGNDPTTIACWAKADNTSIPDWTLIFGFTGTADGAGGCGSHFNIGSLGGPGGVGAHAWCWEETIFSDTQALEWHHYAMTYDGTTITYYGDGAQMDTDPGKSNVIDLSIRGDRVHIGSRVTQASSFPGKVDDCRVYDYALTDAEVAGLFMPSNPLADTWSDDGAVSTSLAAGKAMRIAYDSGTGSVRAAIESMDLTWGPNAIAMSVYGNPDNAAAGLFVAVEDGAGNIAIVPVIDSAAAVQTADWTTLLVALDDITTAGANIADIVKVAVGVEASGAGTILVDDLRTVRIWEYVPRNWAITLDIPGSLSLSGPDKVFTTDHIIRQGEVFTLSISVRVGAGAIWDDKNITMSILADGAVVANKTGPCADGWKQYSVTFNSANAPAKDGTLVGVRFRNEIHNTLALKNIKLTAK
ncbi:MAG: hypothetical protein JW741_25720 [Sedimentisphaerales bacterium]|nr:hypothetical protein [Sedimentisphaerales bacterium]